MNNYKNLLIAILTGLLALSLTLQFPQVLGTSREAKKIQYAMCLEIYRDATANDSERNYLNDWIQSCTEYRP